MSLATHCLQLHHEEQSATHRTEVFKTRLELRHHYSEYYWLWRQRLASLTLLSSPESLVS
ncbi:hypothetical protein E2C01_053365 [Portunus trituberculatus]|uniref:Uncharacterized protein n=1 Tax=Portunus trituberculatus TaxID=210409 RepID=A0A5B7GP87_PORTR|nr:hypothetical protein [Portunus trituberculatus]